MDLHSRFRQWRETRTDQAVESPPAPVGEATRPVPATLPGNWQPTVAGHSWVAEHRLPLDEEYAGHLARRWLEIDPGYLTRLARRQDTLLTPRNLAFLDAETTGLTGGTGTVAFLVSLGRVTDEALIIRQHFLTDLDQEPAFLAALADDLAPIEGLVTFNGKSFDLPLLRDRFTLHAHALARRQWPHLDLLHASRRLWGRQLPSCTLQELEREVLGLWREDDVPGSQAPARFFLYLDTGDDYPLAEVFRHNLADTRSLISLALALVDRLTARPPAGMSAGEWLGRGRWLEAQGEVGGALEAYDQTRRVLDGAANQDASLWWEAVRRHGVLLKRQGRWLEACRLWSEALAQADVLSPLFPYVELAKYYEHQAKDPGRALELVDRALEVLSLRPSLARARPEPPSQGRGSSPNRTATLRAELDHRRERLLTRLSRRQNSGA